MPLRTTAFRVRRVTTTSLTLHMKTAYNLKGYHITTHIPEDFLAFLKITSESWINAAFAATVFYYIRIHEKGQFLFHE